MNRSADRRRRAQLAALCVSVLVVALTTPVVQGLYSDPAVQLRAVQQRLLHDSTSINTLVQPDKTDLSRDAGTWIMWWTPGTQIVAFPLMRAGLPLGHSLRVVSAAALILGSIGWATWFSCFAMPDAVLFALAAFFPCIRYGSNSLFLYSAETLVFGAGPWMLVATVALLGRTRGGIRGAVEHVLLGLLLGAAYWLKDSLGFVAFGAIAAIAIVGWRGVRELPAWISRCTAVAAGAAVPFLVLAVLNATLGGSSTKVSAGLALHLPDWRIAVDALALPALQAADAFALWDYLLMHPSHPVVRDAMWIAVIGLPGGLVTWWLCDRPAESGAAAVLARTTLACSLATLVAIWIISASVDHKPRHIATAAFAVLPLAVSEGWRRWPGLGTARRAILMAAGVGYVCVPLAYGAVSVVAKVRRFPPGYRPGPARIYNPLLADTDLASVRETLLARTRPDAIWYLSDPLSALDLPGRSIGSSADFDTLADLERTSYVTSRPLGVRALMPARFEANGKGEVIRRSFPQAGRWESTKIPGSDYWLWTTNLVPGR